MLCDPRKVLSSAKKVIPPIKLYWFTPVAFLFLLSVYNLSKSVQPPYYPKKSMQNQKLLFFFLTFLGFCTKAIVWIGIIYIIKKLNGDETNFKIYCLRLYIVCGGKCQFEQPKSIYVDIGQCIILYLLHSAKKEMQPG